MTTETMRSAFICSLFRAPWHFRFRSKCAAEIRHRYTAQHRQRSGCSRPCYKANGEWQILSASKDDHTCASNFTIAAGRGDTVRDAKMLREERNTNPIRRTRRKRESHWFRRSRPGESQALSFFRWWMDWCNRSHDGACFIFHRP